MAMNPKKKKIFEEADRDIQKIQSQKNPATEDVQRQTGAESDVEKASRQRAQQARTLLAGLPKEPKPKDTTSAEDYGKIATSAMKAMGKDPDEDKKKKKTLLTGKK
jgi:hypothetical protein